MEAGLPIPTHSPDALREARQIVTETAGWPGGCSLTLRHRATPGDAA